MKAIDIIENQRQYNNYNQKSHTGRNLIPHNAGENLKMQL
jgi:hypothetical protein